MDDGRWAAGIGELYEAVVDDAAWEAFPALAARLVGARSCVSQLIEGGRPVDLRWSYFDEHIMADLARWHTDGRDIWNEAGIRSGVVGRAMVVDDLLPEDVFLRSVLWNEVVRGNGDDTGRSMGIMHRLDGATLMFSFQRAYDAGPFGRADAARFDAIATDVHRIHRARRVLGQRDGRIARLTELLAGVRARAMLLGLDLDLLEASPAARSIIDRADGITVRGGRLVMLDSGIAEPLTRAVNATLRHQSVGQAAFLCSRGPGLPPWRLLVLAAGRELGGGCLVLIGDDAPPRDRLRLWLTQHFGATPAEAAVGEMLVAGARTEAIASARRTSLHTVRTQIRMLLEKTGCHSAVQLVALLATFI